MKQVLSQADLDKIAALVASVEKNTAAELVTAVFKQSAGYSEYRIGWSVGVALALTTAIDLLFPTLPARELLGIEGILGVMSYGLLGIPSILRRIVPREAQRKAVHDRVRQLFLDLGVTETRDRSGVIIYLSLLERRVEILGDRGIHKHLGEKAWQELVQTLVTKIRDGKATEGLSRVIEQLGVELATHFPARDDDTDELPNTVVTDSRS